MRSKITKTLCLLLVAATGIFMANGRLSADVIDVDKTALTPEVAAAVQASEDFWEARIQAYSTEVPKAILQQLTSIRVVCSIVPIDGPGGVIGQAGPTAFLSMTQTSGATFEDTSRAVTLSATLQFDLDDVPISIADGSLEFVALHEFTHALGFGSFLFDLNDLTNPVGGIGVIQYTDGPYGLSTYRRESGNPVAAFIPLEQAGGGGTAGSHWAFVPPVFDQLATFNRACVMRGFLQVLDDDGNIIIPQSYVPETTAAVMADLGYAVSGINDQFAAPPGTGLGAWPKTYGRGVDPFKGNGVAIGDGDNLTFNLVNVMTVLRENADGAGETQTGEPGQFVEDPYNLRRHRWVDPSRGR